MLFCSSTAPTINFIGLTLYLSMIASNNEEKVLRKYLCILQVKTRLKFIWNKTCFSVWEFLSLLEILGKKTMSAIEEWAVLSLALFVIWGFPKCFRWIGWIQFVVQGKTFESASVSLKQCTQHHKLELYHSIGKTSVRDRVFAFDPNPRTVIYEIPWILLNFRSI